MAQDDTATRLKALEERVQAQDAEIRRLKEMAGQQVESTDGLRSEIEAFLAKEGDGSFLDRDGTLRPFFAPGLRFSSADKSFQFRVGGRIMLDATLVDADKAIEDAFGRENFDNFYEFRRVWLNFQGRFYENVEFRSQYGIEGEAVSFKDMWIRLRTGFANITVGNQKEPFGLEELTPSKFITFMERALPDVFAPSRSVGLQLNGDCMDGKVNWGAGWFWGEAPSGTMDHAFTVRVAYAPILENEGEQLLHFGLALSVRDPDSETVRYRQRPEVHTTARLVDTGTIGNVDKIRLIGLETAYTSGPLSAQAEVTWASVDSDSARDPNFRGYYVQVSYWLTGEHRAYGGGVFSRVSPTENFGKGGLGAWEVRIRYSYLDLADGAVEGGKLSDVTLGVNWHLNPTTRVMLEYVLAKLENADLDKSVGALQLRFQVDF